MKTAVVGSGISGLVCAYLLADSHDVTLFEANNYVGGHTHTVAMRDSGTILNIDTGFIVFNEWTYPNFIRLLERLGVGSKSSSMGFSVSCEATGLEYSGNSLSGLFAQRSNLLSPSHYRMIWDIVRFFRDGKRFLQQADEAIALGAFLAQGNYSRDFSEKFLIPMMSAIWSAAPADVLRFPAAHFLRFFKNHGLLNIWDRPVWRVVEGGSSRYAEKISGILGDRLRLNTPVRRIRRRSQSVDLEFGDGSTESFDEVIVAVHSDQALRLLADPTDAEREVLGAIPYQKNEVVLHTDTALLPKNRRAWSSWNYRLMKKTQDHAVLTYNMNLLQGLESDQTYCVTLNNAKAIDPQHVLGHFIYHHPVYSAGAIEAQRRWAEISGTSRTHYCGAYWGYGFHEDGVNSALAVCEAFGKGLD